MKKFNKILIIPIILSCFILNYTTADHSDCWEFWNMVYSDLWSFNIVEISRWTGTNRNTNFLTIDEQLAIIWKDDLNTALLNLKKFCCENQIGDVTADSCKKDEPYFNANALDSKYLFDHLFDVIMRRLNWITVDTDIYTKTKMTVDDKWEKRRNRIEEQAEKKEWLSPQTIITEYQKVWEQSPSNLWYNITTKIYPTFWDLSNQDFLTYVSWKWSTWSNAINESKFIANALKNYDKRTLYDRYINACALSEYFYVLLDIWTDSYDKKKVINKLSDGSCDKIIEQQIDWENEYVRLVTQKSSNLFLSNYVEWYISYLYWRQEKLQKLRTDTKDRLMDVVRLVPNLEDRSIK